MKRIGEFFKQRWVITLIGLIALAILVWFGGPFLGFGPSRPLATPFARLLLILILVVIWGAHNLWLQVRSRRANARMIDDIGQGDDRGEALAQQSAEEAATLRERFNEAMTVLKQTQVRGAGGRHYVYELPWYIIIGPPGAGKTTALANSGLEFPLADRFGKEAMRGVGGTRNCDWWFTNDAVLLDTAGRYTTQDSQQSADSAAWQNFLSLLKKFRPRRPINGILVAISLDEVIQQGSDMREQHARAIRSRIGELYDRLGVQAPIYLMFTKVDLLTGFTEFFDDMDREQRAQVWGTTLGDTEAQALETIVTHFGSEYDALLTRLNQRLLWRLQEERDVSRRGLLHRFPQQMAAIKPALENFLEITFRPNRYEQKKPRLRGIYFTSGTQEGTPIDRVMASLARNFGVSPQAVATPRNQGRSYFLTRLLREVVFREAGLVGANRRFEKQLRLLQIGGYVAVFGLSVLVIIAWAAGFARNRGYLGALENHIVEYQTAARALKPQASLENTLPALNAAHAIAGTYAQDGDHSVWTLGMGLIHAHELAAASHAAYRRVLQSLLLPYLRQHVEMALAGDVDQPEKLQETLAIYLMLGKPDTLHPPVVERWAVQDAVPVLGSDATAREQFKGHLERLFADPVPASQLKPQLVADARQAVCRIPIARQVYSRLGQMAESADLPAFSLMSVGPDVPRYFQATGKSTGVPGFYTATGYQTIVVKETPTLAAGIIDQNRRLCSGFDTAKADADAVSKQVRERYFEDYTAHWDAFLDGLRIRGFSSTAQSASTLKALSNADSPLAKLLGSIAGQLALPASATPAPAKPNDKAKAKAKAPATHLVSERYKELVALTRADGSNPPPVSALIAALGGVRDSLLNVTGSADSGKAAYQLAAQRMGGGSGDAIGKLRRMAADLPAPVAGWMNIVAGHVWGGVLGGARGYINQQWRAIVVQPYRDSLANRYPLSRNASRQATLADFGHFFGPGGILPGFIKDYLRPFVDTRTWQLNSAGHHGLALSTSDLRMLHRGAEIGELFFHNGSQQPAISFSLKPIDLSADASRFVLDVAGQTIDYRHGPRRSSSMQWPGPDGQGARIVFQQINGGDLTITKEGPWAWFQLLDAARIEGGNSAEVLRVTFTKGKLKARYQLRASSVDNPFHDNILQQFRLPDSL